MGDPPSDSTDTDLPHTDAVEEFVDRVETAEIDAVERLILFGSVANAMHAADSDVDVLAIVDSEADVHGVEERLRDLAYDTMLDLGVVFSIHAVTAATYERRADHPFFQTVSAEGTPIYG